jgi:ABC-type dipeptide/oligopeptide/nickel transport system permease subunit
MTFDWNRVVGLTGIFLLYALALFAPILATHHPFEVIFIDQPQQPSPEHIFGTDQLGRDILSRSIYALRHSLIISTIASLSILAVGAGMGILSGYFGGILDWGFVGLMDCMLAFPTLLLTIGICATLGPGTTTILLSLIATGWASTARVVRSAVQNIKTKEFVTSSRLLGANHFHIILHHILPHCAPVLSILFVMTLATTLLAESSLSFLGFGLPPPHPTLGKLVYEGARFFRIAPWWSFFPGLLIALGIISFNLLGDSLRRSSTRNTPHD